jgi:uncharacterized membrane protein YeaQ/YmgE (transglycosylase-associated protein family)
MDSALGEFLTKLKAIGIIVGIGAIMSYLYYNLKRKDLFGGYIGGLVVGIIGAIIGVFVIDFLFQDIAARILVFLTQDVGVNVITGFIGAWIALYIMNRLNHDKERKKF